MKTKRSFLTIFFLSLLSLLFAIGFSACSEAKDSSSSNPSPNDSSSIERCVVKIDSQGGSIKNHTLIILSGTKLSRLESPTKEGYIFDGWYVGDEKWSFIGYEVTENITLTAKWTPVNNFNYP